MAGKETPPKPRSIIEAPLSPPPTDEKLVSNISRIVDVIRNHRKGLRPNISISYRLNPEDYAELLEILAKESLLNYVEDKVRYDYDPRRHSRLTIHMPTPIHEVFCAKIVREITVQLESIKHSNGPGARFAKNIDHFVSSRIELPEDTNNEQVRYIRYEPDASFGHHRARYPGVIIEVCYSQNVREIYSRADDYILNTNGSVNAVICLDIKYKDSKEATLLIWRPRYTTRDEVVELEAALEKNEHFRTSDGQPVKSTSLRLTLKDFATEELTDGHTQLDQEILISSEELCEFLSDAEARQRAQEQRGGSTNNVRPGARKRRRSETPPDKVSSEDELIERKRGRPDSDYDPSSPFGNSTD